MKKIPYGQYTKEFREETVRLVIENGLSAGEAASQLFLPKSTLENCEGANQEPTRANQSQPGSQPGDVID